MIEIYWDQRLMDEAHRALLASMPSNYVNQDLAISGKIIKREGSVYPPDFPGNTYKRTGFLGSSWYQRMQGNSLFIGNIASYADLVVGDHQEWYHAAHGWPKIRGVILAELDELIKRIIARLDRIWR